MVAELVPVLVGFNVGLLLVLLARLAWHRTRVPALAYALWALPPLMAIAAALPRPEALTIVATTTLPSLPATTVLAAAPVASRLGESLLIASLAGTFLLTARLAIGHHRLRRRLRHAPRQGVPRAPGLTTVRADFGPALIGLFRPVLVLPEDFEQRFTPRQQALAIEHEWRHWRSGDVVARTIAWGLASLQWWNPLVWLALPNFIEDQELANDARVLARCPGAESDYAQALVAATRGPVSPLACAMQPAHPLLRRIAMLNAHRPSRPARIGMACLTALSLVAATSVAWALDTTPGTVAAGDFRVAVQIAVDGGPASRFGLGGPSGVPMAARIDTPEGPVEFDIALQKTGLPGQVLAEMAIRRDGTTVAEPELQLMLGGEGRIEVGSEDPQGRFSGIGIDLTVTDATSVAAPVPAEAKGIPTASLRRETPIWQAGTAWIRTAQDPDC